MSKNAKIAVGIVIVLVLAGAAYYWYQNSHTTASGTLFTNASTTLPSGNDTSDQGLQQDTAAIDAQMKGLSSDQATVNSSVNGTAQSQ